VFIAARAFVLPGLSVGEASIVGSCGMVNRTVITSYTVMGNPARLVAWILCSYSPFIDF
jgi:acetyltransferase-like isoleucine patch superfamily enzyme